MVEDIKSERATRFSSEDKQRINSVLLRSQMGEFEVQSDDSVTIENKLMKPSGIMSNIKIIPSKSSEESRESFAGQLRNSKEALIRQIRDDLDYFKKHHIGQEKLRSNIDIIDHIISQKGEINDRSNVLTPGDETLEINKSSLVLTGSEVKTNSYIYRPKWCHNYTPVENEQDPISAEEFHKLLVDTKKKVLNEMNKRQKVKS